MTARGSGPETPRSVLFACTLNSVRSPMAEAIAKHFFGNWLYVDSVGVEAGVVDPLAVKVMAEIGIDISDHECKSFEDLAAEDTHFDLVISFSPEAHHRAVELTRTSATEIEYWPTLDPGMGEGSRESQLEHYRGIRDGLIERLKARFPLPKAPKV